MSHGPFRDPRRLTRVGDHEEDRQHSTRDWVMKTKILTVVASILEVAGSPFKIRREGW